MQTQTIDGINVAIAQMNVIAGQPRTNADWIINQIEEAELQGKDLIIFPELCVSGYLIGDTFEDDSFVRDVWRQNERIVKATTDKKVTVIFGTLVTDDPAKTGEDGRMRKINGGIVAQGGEALSCNNGLPFFAKTNLPKYRMFDEVRHMTTSQLLAAERGLAIEDFLDIYEIPLSDGRVLRAAVVDCEDSWMADYLIKVMNILAEKGISIIINVSASPWGWQKTNARHRQFGAALFLLGIVMLYANIVGTQNNSKGIYVFDGASTMYNPEGKVAAAAKPFEEQIMQLTLSDDMPEIDFREESDVAQLYRGIDAGLDGIFETIPPHLRKLSTALSGGIDSGVMTALGVLKLGAANVYNRNMPFMSHNSDRTKNAAQHTAGVLGTNYDVWPLDDIVLPKLERYGMSLDHPGVETVLAMERKNQELGLARAIGGVAFCTGNKTEISVGFYCNDGDGRGAAAPIGDLWKGEVRQLAYFLNKEIFQKEVIPFDLIDGGIPAAAELGKTVPDPYDYGYVTREGEYVRGYHDQMMRAIVEYRRNPEWLLERYAAGDLQSKLLLPDGKLASLFDSPQAFVTDVERCWNNFWAATWKRHQAPMVIAVSKRPFAFDYREFVGRPYYTDRFFELKQELLTQ